MELKIYNPTAENTVKAIDWNFEELKQEIMAKANDYKLLVYTDDKIKDAKADRANLNKFIKALEDKRKEIKKMFLEPYTQFESQIKELVGIISEANLNIDSQVKAYEQKKKDEKLEKIKEIYDEKFANCKDIIPWEKAFKASYLNASITMKNITDEMEDLKCRVTRDLEIINSDTGEYQFEMKEEYLKSFSMTEALLAKQRYKKNARKKAEYEARRKALEEEQILKEKEETEKVFNIGKKQETIPKQEEAKEQQITIEFKVTGTMEQLDGLKKYLVENHITYGPVMR